MQQVINATMAESMLLGLSKHDAHKKAKEMLARAVSDETWDVAAYLSDYLNDTTTDHSGGHVSAEVINFFHVDPAVPRGDYFSIDNPSPYFSLSEPKTSLRFMLDRDDIVIAGSNPIRVQINCPNSTMDTVKISPATSQGFTREDLAMSIAQEYKKLYRPHNYDKCAYDLADMDLQSVVYDNELETYKTVVVS